MQLIKSLKFIAKSIKRFDPNRQKFFWIGRAPAWIMWERMTRLFGVELAENSKLSLLNFELLEELVTSLKFQNIFRESRRIIYHRTYEQEIFKNSTYEDLLLRESSLNYSPHEVCQIILLTKQHKVYRSPIFHGEEARAVDISTLENWIEKLDYKVRKDGFDVLRIQINHTHPTLEFVEYLAGEGNQCRLSLSGLSQADFEVGRRLAASFKHPIQLKAITPSGLFFSSFM